MPDRQGAARSDHPAYRINEVACAFFQRTLASTQGSEARAYMESRGLDRTAAETFQLGLAPYDGESLRGHLLREDFDPGQLIAAGVVREGDDGRQRDLFRGRLMIPIRDADGRLAGFGGRALDDSQPKYLNSPQSEVFDKSRILYAMDRARDDIRRNGAVIVEGYMDAIAAHQAGFHNVVASMGTALTEPQVNIIRRLTGQVTMALDQDSAGQQATLRSLESSWRIYQGQVARQTGSATLLQRPELPEIRIAALPPGQDPDDVIRRSPEEWRGLMENARPLLEFVITAMAASVDPASPNGKAAIAEQVSRLIYAVQDAPQQDHYLRLLADALEVPLETLLASIRRPAPPRRARVPQQRQPAAMAQEEATASPFARLDHDRLEEDCLALLIRFPELWEYAGLLTAELFSRPENREIFINHMDKATGTHLPGQEEEEPAEAIPLGIRERIEALREKSMPVMDLVKRRWAIAENVANLENRYLKQLKRDEQDRFAGSPEDVSEEDLERAAALNRRIKENEDLRRNIRANR